MNKIFCLLLSLLLLVGCGGENIVEVTPERLVISENKSLCEINSPECRFLNLSAPSGKMKELKIEVVNSATHEFELWINEAKVTPTKNGLTFTYSIPLEKWSGYLLVNTKTSGDFKIQVSAVSNENSKEFLYGTWNLSVRKPSEIFPPKVIVSQISTVCTTQVDCRLLAIKIPTDVAVLELESSQSVNASVVLNGKTQQLTREGNKFLLNVQESEGEIILQSLEKGAVKVTVSSTSTSGYKTPHGTWAVRFDAPPVTAAPNIELSQISTVCITEVDCRLIGLKIPAGVAKLELEVSSFADAKLMLNGVIQTSSRLANTITIEINSNQSSEGEIIVFSSTRGNVNLGVISTNASGYKNPHGTWTVRFDTPVENPLYKTTFVLQTPEKLGVQDNIPVFLEIGQKPTDVFVKDVNIWIRQLDTFPVKEYNLNLEIQNSSIEVNLPTGKYTIDFSAKIDAGSDVRAFHQFEVKNTSLRETLTIIPIIRVNDQSTYLKNLRDNLGARYAHVIDYFPSACYAMSDYNSLPRIKEKEANYTLSVTCLNLNTFDFFESKYSVDAIINNQFSPAGKPVSTVIQKEIEGTYYYTSSVQDQTVGKKYFQFSQLKLGTIQLQGTLLRSEVVDLAKIVFASESSIHVYGDTFLLTQVCVKGVVETLQANSIALKKITTSNDISCFDGENKFYEHSSPRPYSIIDFSSNTDVEVVSVVGKGDTSQQPIELKK
jgi:hypothetical protein